jgi:AraC-like DNA-binding protein
MKVDRRYYQTRTVHRTLPCNADDPANGIVSCGFLYKQDRSYVQKDILFQNYGGLYVISGSGVYVDAETGKEYSVTPGCVVQRMPGKRHHSYIHHGEDWLEFYFCASARMFRTLVDLKLATDEPVFYVGESMDIFLRLADYHAMFERTDNARSFELLMEFQKLLCYLNSRAVDSKTDSWAQTVGAVIEKNYRVGISLEDIAVQCGMGYEALRKKFRMVFGCSLEQYRIQLRINAAKSMMLDRDMPLKQIASELGYCDTYAFCKQFKQQVGCSPGKFKADWIDTV